MEQMEVLPCYWKNGGRKLHPTTLDMRSPSVYTMWLNEHTDHTVAVSTTAAEWQSGLGRNLGSAVLKLGLESGTSLSTLFWILLCSPPGSISLSTLSTAWRQPSSCTASCWWWRASSPQGPSGTCTETSRSPPAAAASAPGWERAAALVSHVLTAANANACLLYVLAEFKYIGEYVNNEIYTSIGQGHSTGHIIFCLYVNVHLSCFVFWQRVLFTCM